MMEGNSPKDKETKKQKPQEGKFQIKVKNKFDSPTEARSIRIRHSSEQAFKVLPPKKRKCTDPERYATEDWPKEEYELTRDEYLIIELDDEMGNFTNDVYIELPYIADYELYWEVKKDDKEKKLSRPITKIMRDTGEPKKGKQKLLDKAKTVIVIPADQTAWKLEIKSPQNMQEHHIPKTLLNENLQQSNGTSDDVSVGDNGEG
jgi:hypothetical protein